MYAVVVSTIFGLMLPAQTARAQALDGSAMAAHSSEVRPAKRRQARQLTDADVVVAAQPQTRREERAGQVSSAVGLTKPIKSHEVRPDLAGQALRRGLGKDLNSPLVDVATTRSFHELNLHGAWNAAGFAVTGIRKGTIPYELEVKGVGGDGASANGHWTATVGHGVGGTRARSPRCHR